MRALVLGGLLFVSHLATAQSWQEALGNMLLREPVSELNRSNCVRVMLQAFEPAPQLKALIFMPGATDEFYFFRRATAHLSSTNQTLLHATSALTNQTLIKATFRSPFLLLHTAEDPLEPAYTIEHSGTFAKLQTRIFLKRFLWNDRDWDFIHPFLTFHANMRVSPGRFSAGTTHFFRHSMAGGNLSVLQALEAISLANKTRFTIGKRRILFEGDERFNSKPTVPSDWWALPAAR